MIYLGKSFKLIEVKKQFFLKWTEAELLAQINNVLEYFESERLIDLQEQRIQINDADDSLKFLSAFAHLWTESAKRLNSAEEHHDLFKISKRSQTVKTVWLLSLMQASENIVAMALNSCLFFYAVSIKYSGKPDKSYQMH